MPRQRFDFREHFRLNPSSEYGCNHCRRPLLHPCTDKLGRLMCAPCFREICSNEQAQKIPVVFERLLKRENVICVHCEHQVEYSAVKEHLDKECTVIFRTVEEVVNAHTFDILERLRNNCVGIEPQLHSTGLIRVLRGHSGHYELEEKEYGVVCWNLQNGCLYVTNYGRVIRLHGGELYCTEVCSVSTLSYSLQWAIQRMDLSAYAFDPEHIVGMLKVLSMAEVMRK
jgi:hypothetical protein